VSAIYALLTLLVLTIIVSLCKGIWTNGLAYILGFGIKWKTGDNVWAVITGATDGIGLEYAKQLAQIGYNLVIISRSEDKLKATQKSIKDKYKKEVRIIAVDFSRTDIYDKIRKEFNSLEVIDVLVNNVGVLYKCPEFFTEIGSDFNESYLNININSYVKLIEIVLPKMVKQNRGIIINISSQAAIVETPLMTTYSATKAFVNFLSEGIGTEYESKGVTVQTVMPSLTRTNMLMDGMDSSFFVVSAKDFVSSALKTVGIESTTCGHWKHKLSAFIIVFLSKIIGRKAMIKIIFNEMKKNKNEFHRKTDRKAD